MLKPSAPSLRRRAARTGTWQVHHYTRSIG